MKTELSPITVTRKIQFGMTSPISAWPCFLKSRYSKFISYEASDTPACIQMCQFGYSEAGRLRFPYKYRECNSGSWSKLYSQCAHEIAQYEKKQSSQALCLLLPYFQFYMSNGILERSHVMLEGTLQKGKKLSIRLIIKVAK